MIGLHGRVQRVLLELMHVMFGFLHALPGQNTFTLFMYLEHVEFGLFAGPPKNLLEDMGDVIHVIDGIIPANYQVTRLQFRLRFFLFFPDDVRPHFRGNRLCHSAKIRDERGLVEAR